MSFVFSIGPSYPISETVTHVYRAKKTRNEGDLKWRFLIKRVRAQCLVVEWLQWGRRSWNVPRIGPSHPILQYNKLNPILLILINLFQTPHASKCEWTEWNKLLSYLPLIDNDIVVKYLYIAGYILHSTSPYSLFIQPLHPLLLPSSLPKSYRVLHLELQSSKVKDK